MIIFVDIDNTICYSEPPNYIRSIPKQDAIDRINKLYEEGNTIVYWTARGASSKNDWSELTQWQLKEWGVKYHELRLDKPYFDLLIDDKAVTFDKL